MGSTSSFKNNINKHIHKYPLCEWRVHVFLYLIRGSPGHVRSQRIIYCEEYLLEIKPSKRTLGSRSLGDRLDELCNLPPSFLHTPMMLRCSLAVSYFISLLTDWLIHWPIRIFLLVSVKVITPSVESVAHLQSFG